MDAEEEENDQEQEEEVWGFNRVVRDFSLIDQEASSPRT